MSQSFRQAGPLVLIGCGKAKRDPNDPSDLEKAVERPNAALGESDPEDEQPTWRARDLYTSSYSKKKQAFAEVVTKWADDQLTPAWAILSAKHGIVFPDELLTYYNTSIDDLGDDPNDPEDRVELTDFSNQPRRPDGEPVATEMDMWAHDVANTLSSWVRSFQPLDVSNPMSSLGATNLLVLAGRSYLDPLRERGTFAYGASRMYRTGNGTGLPIQTRFLFEEIDAPGNGAQMQWLDNAIERITTR